MKSVIEEMRTGGNVRFRSGYSLISDGEKISVSTDAIHMGGNKGIRDYARKVAAFFNENGFKVGTVRHSIYGIYTMEIL